MEIGDIREDHKTTSDRFVSALSTPGVEFTLKCSLVPRQSKVTVFLGCCCCWEVLELPSPAPQRATSRNEVEDDREEGVKDDDWKGRRLMAVELAGKADSNPLADKHFDRRS